MKTPKNLSQLDAMSSEQIEQMDKQAEGEDFPEKITAVVSNVRFPQDKPVLTAGNVMYTTYIIGGTVYARYKTPFGGIVDKTLSAALRDKYTNG